MGRVRERGYSLDDRLAEVNSPDRPLGSGLGRAEGDRALPAELLLARATEAAAAVPAKYLRDRRAKYGLLRFPLAPSAAVDLGPWRAIDWPAAELAAAEAHFASLRQYEIEPFQGFWLRSAAVIGPHLSVARGNTILAESTRGLSILLKSNWFQPGSSHDHLALPAQATIGHRPGLSVAIGTRASGQFFHWMVEMLPRLILGAALARKQGGTLLMLPITAAYQWETLAVIAPGTRVAFAEADITHCDEVIFPEQVIRSGIGIRPISPLIGLGFDRLLKGFAVPTKPPQRRLYISRADAGRRHVLNEAELEPVLRRHGFEIVTLGRLRVSQQAALFHEAEIVIGLHGAGLTNAGFCQPGTPLVEIMPVGLHLASPYWLLAGLRGLPYINLAGRDAEGGQPSMNGDYIVSPAGLEAAILAADALRRG